VAYESIPKATRARWHAHFADWIVRKIGARDEVAPLLAHHYAASISAELSDMAWGQESARVDELREHAIRWLRRAGAELAFETAGRPGMWTRFPDRSLVQRWIDRALELTESGTPGRARAVGWRYTVMTLTP
jgi:hypothetical protein